MYYMGDSVPGKKLYFTHYIVVLKEENVYLSIVFILWKNGDWRVVHNITWVLSISVRIENCKNIAFFPSIKEFNKIILDESVKWS